MSFINKAFKIILYGVLLIAAFALSLLTGNRSNEGYKVTDFVKPDAAHADAPYAQPYYQADYYSQASYGEGSEGSEGGEGSEGSSSG